MSRPTNDQITALLLAGGQARRMGGVDKGQQFFDGVPLAARVLKRLEGQARTILISANRSLDWYSRFGFAVFEDAPRPTPLLTPPLKYPAGHTIPSRDRSFVAPASASTTTTSSPFAGPLAGIHAGLRHANTPYLLVVPCDVPLVPTDLAQRLGDALEQNQAQIAYAVTGPPGHATAHFVCALMHTELVDDLGVCLAQGERRVRAWYARHKSIEVQFDNQAAFYNINTLQQLDAAAPDRE